MARIIRRGFNDPKWRTRIQCLGVFVDQHPFEEGQGTFYGCGAVFRIGRDDLHTDYLQIRWGSSDYTTRLRFACPDCGMRNDLPEAWVKHFKGLPNVDEWFAAHPDVPTAPTGFNPKPPRPAIIL